jgi:hypothetical protein
MEDMDDTQPTPDELKVRYFLSANKNLKKKQ